MDLRDRRNIHFLRPLLQRGWHPDERKQILQSNGLDRQRQYTGRLQCIRCLTLGLLPIPTQSHALITVGKKIPIRPQPIRKHCHTRQPPGQLTATRTKCGFRQGGCHPPEDFYGKDIPQRVQVGKHSLFVLWSELLREARRRIFRGFSMMPSDCASPKMQASAKRSGRVVKPALALKQLTDFLLPKPPTQRIVAAISTVGSCSRSSTQPRINVRTLSLKRICKLPQIMECQKKSDPSRQILSGNLTLPQPFPEKIIDRSRRLQVLNTNCCNIKTVIAQQMALRRVSLLQCLRLPPIHLIYRTNFHVPILLLEFLCCIRYSQEQYHAILHTPRPFRQGRHKPPMI